MGLGIQFLEKNCVKLYLNNVNLKRYFRKQAVYPSKLAEVGRFQDVKVHGIYEPGQLFLHRIFGYRGVILFAWKAKVFDRDAKQEPQHIQNSFNNSKNLQSALSLQKNEIQMSSEKVGESSGTSYCKQRFTGSPEHAEKFHTFYQALIDARDCPHIRAQTEAVTFLGNQDTTRSLYAIPGLDYVAHDDIMPYSSSEKYPLHHELFDKFLEYVPDKHPPFVAQETLKAWQEKYNLWLELSDVHKETTENIRITVIPFYMGCRDSPSTSVYWWRYCIRIENLGTMSVQLRERHWRIFSLSGTLETVRGRGVVGQEPILSTKLPAFQYSSHVSLQAPSGHMWGTFRLEREDGYTFDCKIPPFSLESKPDESPTPETSEPDVSSKTNKKNENKKDTNV